MEITEELRIIFGAMLSMLKKDRLEVILVPHPEVGTGRIDSWAKIRVVVNQNPKWYRDLCFNNPSTGRWSRKYLKQKTVISRKNIINVLKKMSMGKETKSIYVEQLINCANGILDDWEYEREQYELSK